MALSTIALTNTFNEWRVNHNQIIVIINNLTEGHHNTSGVIDMSNPSAVNGGVTLNVRNGRIVTLNIVSNNMVTAHQTITGDLLIAGNVVLSGASASLNLL